MDFFDSIFSNYFWNHITNLNKTNEKIIDNIYFLMENMLRNNLSIPEEVYNTFLDNIRKERSIPGSTHPSISERAKELGAIIPSLNNSFHGDLLLIFNSDYKSSLRTLFKKEADKILKTMSLKWLEISEERWNEYYTYIDGLNSELNSLSYLEEEKDLDVDKLIEKAHLTEILYDKDLAFKIFNEALTIDPKNIAARFNVARIMLINGNDEGVEIFRSIGEEEAQLRPDCCKHIYNYYLSVNNISEAVQYYSYAIGFMKTNEEVADERNIIYLNDELLPHNLSLSTLDKIIKEISKYKDIKRAYIATKKLNISKDFPLYSIGIKYSKLSTKKRRSFISNSLVKDLSSIDVFPWDFKVISLNREHRSFEYNIDNVLGSRIL